jgi:hypothetical protein
VKDFLAVGGGAFWNISGDAPFDFGALGGSEHQLHAN